MWWELNPVSVYPLHLKYHVGYSSDFYKNGTVNVNTHFETTSQSTIAPTTEEPTTTVTVVPTTAIESTPSSAPSTTYVETSSTYSSSEQFIVDNGSSNAVS